MGKVEVGATSESLGSSANTAAKNTAEVEPDTKDKNEEKEKEVLEMDADVTCECRDQNKDNNKQTKDSDIRLDIDVTGDRKVDIGRARATVLFRPYIILLFGWVVGVGWLDKS